MPTIAGNRLQRRGGNGFIEENPMARVYREAPLNSVWEGTANMMCMDVRRAMLRDARTIDALFEELRPLQGQDDRFDALVTSTKQLVLQALEDEFLARPMTETVARTLQAAELMRYSTPDVVAAFLATRSPGSVGAWGSMFGTMGSSIGKSRADRIVDRALVTGGWRQIAIDGKPVTVALPGSRWNGAAVWSAALLGAFRFGVDPDVTPARANLSRLYSRTVRNADAERALTEALQRVPGIGELRYSLGLLLAEDGRMMGPRGNELQKAGIS